MTTQEAARQLADIIDTADAKSAEAITTVLAGLTDANARLAAVEARLAAIEGDAPAPLPPDVVTPPDRPAKYTRHTPVKNESAEAVGLSGAPSPGIWITEGRHAIGAFTAHGMVKGRGDWIHGAYLAGGSLTVQTMHVTGAIRDEKLSRDHLAFYASGVESLHIETLIIGHPDDPIPWGTPCKVKSKADPARRVKRVTIGRILAFGGSRQLLKAENEDDDAKGILSAERIDIGSILWVDPGGDGEGRLEALRLYGVGEARIGTVTILDTQGVITKPVACKASGTTGRIGKVRVHFPASLHDRELVQGIDASVEVRTDAPATPRPTEYGPDSVDAWFKWAGGAK